jgi:O-antigen/teichoic acid export membrane protein
MNAEVVLPRTLARATATLFGGNVAMVGLQALQFVLLARLLGVENFGYVAAANALIAIAIPLATLGYGNVLLVRVSRDRSRFRVELGNALVAILLMGGLLVGVAALIAFGLLGGAAMVPLFVTMAVSELVLVRSVVVLGQLYQALERVEVTSSLNIATALCRVVSVVLMMMMGVHDPLTWAMTACGLMLVLATWALLATARALGAPRFDLARLWEDKSDAIHFSLGTGAKAFYTDFDKVVLARTAVAAELGAYTAAYRLIVMTFLPVRSLLEASASQFYRHGAESLAQSHAFARKLLKVALPCGLAGAALLFACAELVPHVLGPSFAATTPMLRALALLPLIQSIHYVFSETLTAAGMQHVRTRLQWVVAAVYAAAALTVIPRAGWQGAVGVCLGCELLLAVFVVVAVGRRVRLGGKKGQGYDEHKKNPDADA